MNVPEPPDEARFPGFDTLAQAHTWDERTRAVIEARVANVPAITFFTSAEARTARTLVDCLLAQETQARVPVLELIDARLAAGEGDGYRYDAMPEDGEAWRRSLAALDGASEQRFGRAFADTSGNQRRTIIESVQIGEGEWYGMPPQRVFDLWMRYACTAFYSHPAAWNDIGFGGPAYPRGYKNIGIGRREPWEVAEVDAEDPVPWAERVDAARRRETRPAAGTGRS